MQIEYFGFANAWYQTNKKCNLKFWGLFKKLFYQT